MNLYKSLIVALFFLISSNIYFRFESNKYEQLLIKETENNKSLDQFLSSYYLMRISLIYYASNDTAIELKERSKRLLLNELSNQDVFILKLKQHHQVENKLFNKMISDYAIVRNLAETISNSFDKKEITNIAYNIFPEKRNAFRVSTEEYYNDINKKIEVKKDDYQKNKKIEQALFLISILNILLILSLKKT